MKKDIFIDTNIAKSFTNPLDKEYIKLIRWLIEDEKAYLVVSNKLLSEYNRSAFNSHTNTSIPLIIGTLTKKGRLVFVSNEQIKEFQNEYYSKKIQKNLRSNIEDREHIPLVLLSERKYALSIDDNFVFDLRNFPGFKVWVEKRPEKLPYSQGDYE